MQYLSFDKNSLVNLEYSLNREILSTNRAGGYFSSTLPLCNTRKYHGLMVLPLERFDYENYVLLSGLDETILTDDRAFNLGIHKYRHIYSPRGHKYLIDFEYAPTPTLWYRIGKILMKKEMLFVHGEEQIMIRYTVMETSENFTFRMKPFLAFRNAHELTKANMEAETRYENAENGVSFCLYKDFPRLYLQLNRKGKWIASPDWYYDIEYKEEIARGYEGHEDLFVPGYFEMRLARGDTLIFSASTGEEKPRSLAAKFKKEVSIRPPKDNFENCLRNSASQFIVERNDRTRLIAGFPWFSQWSRDTFIALPGLTLSLGDQKTCLHVLDSMVEELEDGFFPNTRTRAGTLYNSVDAPLWFFWTLQRLQDSGKSEKKIWKRYGQAMKSILRSFRSGGIYSVHMAENGLIWQGEEGVALTWMDAVSGGVPVTPRTGFAVEVCALWYNAVCYALQLARSVSDDAFVREWESVPGLIEENFLDVFWYEKGKHLADYVDQSGQNTDMRPNQIFAISLPYSLIQPQQQRWIIDRIKAELLTPKGLRTLSPKNLKYKGNYQGSQGERDRAYHQGTVWPWLLAHFVTSHIKLRGREETLQLAEGILASFEEDMTHYGIASISEIYDGDPPHRPKGSVSQAWSVAEILRILMFVKKEKG